MQDIHVATEAEEMYVITVARAIEDGDGPPVPVSTISGVLEVSSVSANQMIKKLETLGLVVYEPYKGVTLTATGSDLADSVLRNRRLWGRFLADHLGLSAAKADEVACEMEHVTPDMVADRLATFLGDPTTGPTGHAIPGATSSERSAERPLTEVPVGESAVIARVGEDSRAFLSSQGLKSGAAALVVGIGADGSILVQTTDGTCHITASIATEISTTP